MSIKATRRTMISCYAQIINDYVLGYKIPELVKHEKTKARKLLNFHRALRFHRTNTLSP